MQGHLDHAYGTVDDLPAGSDDGLRLLAFEHGAGDFLRIGKMADARLDHLDPGLVEAVLYLFAQFFGYGVRITA